MATGQPPGEASTPAHTAARLKKIVVQLLTEKPGLSLGLLGNYASRRSGFDRKTWRSVVTPRGKWGKHGVRGFLARYGDTFIVQGDSVTLGQPSGDTDIDDIDAEGMDIDDIRGNSYLFICNIT